MEKAPTAEREAASRRRKGLSFFLSFFEFFFSLVRERSKRPRATEKEKKREKGELNSHAPHRESERDPLDGVEEREEGHGRELVAEGQQLGLRESEVFFVLF